MIQSESFDPRKILEILSSLFRFEHINIKFLYRHGPGLEIVIRALNYLGSTKATLWRCS